MKLGAFMRKASAKKSRNARRAGWNPELLRLTNRQTRIRGMNIAAAAAREYLKKTDKPRPWPAHLARLIDANLSLMGQQIMARVRRFERVEKAEAAEDAFCAGMRSVGLAAAKELITEGN
jgi:hypothetical protein